MEKAKKILRQPFNIIVVDDMPREWLTNKNLDFLRLCRHDECFVFISS